MAIFRFLVVMVMLLPMVISKEKAEKKKGSLKQRTMIIPRREGPESDIRAGRAGRVVPVSESRLAFAGFSNPNMFPFGSGYGDTTMGMTDDGCETFNLNVDIAYFGTDYNKIWVCKNGLIAFGGAYTEYTPSSFYSGVNHKIIAPFWADGGSGGVVYYGKHTSGPILDQGKELVDGALPGLHQFYPTIAAVITWHDIPFYGADAVGISLKNTFQLAIISDGARTYALAVYEKLEWTTGTSSGGDSSTGLGGTPALIGYTNGHSSGQYWEFAKFSMTQHALKMTRVTNIQGPYVPGWTGTTLMQCNLVGDLAPIMTCLRDNTCCVMGGSVYRPPVPGCQGFTQLDYLNSPTGSGHYTHCYYGLFRTSPSVCACDWSSNVNPDTCTGVGLPHIP